MTEADVWVQFVCGAMVRLTVNDAMGAADRLLVEFKKRFEQSPTGPVDGVWLRKGDPKA